MHTAYSRLSTSAPRSPCRVTPSVIPARNLANRSPAIRKDGFRPVSQGLPRRRTQKDIQALRRYEREPEGNTNVLAYQLDNRR